MAQDPLRFLLNHLTSKNMNFLNTAELKPFHLEEWIKEHPMWNPG
jgi:hypothetical protein